jgi:hypothetical protein
MKKVSGPIRGAWRAIFHVGARGLYDLRLLTLLTGATTLPVLRA